MKFHCPNCKLTGSIDDARVPDQGLYAGCPHCKTRFLIKKEVSPDLAPEQPEPARPAQGRSLAEPSIAVREAVSGLDSETPRPRAVGGSKMIWAAALLLVLIAGIIAAIAIPKSPGTGARDHNAAAMYEIRSAKMLVDHYCIINGLLPETLEQADYHHPQLIDIRFTERSGYRYTIVAAHRYGDTEYALTGNSPDVLSRSKGDTGAFRTIVHDEAR
jgi:hypothetical protein